MTLFPPTPDQFNALMRFLLSNEDQNAECPLLIQGTKHNRPRWDPNKAFAHHHMFRDKYERNVLPEPRHGQDVWDSIHWPELDDSRVLSLVHCPRTDGTPWVTDEQVAEAKANIWNITPTSPLWNRYAAMQAAREGEIRLESEEGSVDQ